MHTPIEEQGAYLRSVLLGHFRYCGVPLNGPAISAFGTAVVRLWHARFSTDAAKAARCCGGACAGTS